MSPIENPSKPFARESTRNEIARSLDRAQSSYSQWRVWPLRERLALLPGLASVLRRRVEELACMCTAEMRKPISEARAEVRRCAELCEYLEREGPRLFGPEYIETPGKRSAIHWSPLGTVLSIMPWNYPYWQVCRAVLPALLLGNSVLLKPAPLVPGCARALEQVLREAGFPGEVMQAIFPDQATTRAIIADPRIHAMSFTGTAGAGAILASVAASHLKKTVLELGGSDAYIVMADADLGVAARLLVESRMQNAGQRCSAAKRFICVQPVLESFAEVVVREMERYAMGAPEEESTLLGPLGTEATREHSHRQVQISLGRGARLRLGGEFPDTREAYYPATLLEDVRPGMPAFDEETFGPVACICPARDEEEAIAMANASEFGLGAGIFSADVERAARIAEERLEAGFVAVNDVVRSDPRLPFGGIGRSGDGREMGTLGFRALSHSKTVVIQEPR